MNVKTKALRDLAEKARHNGRIREKAHSKGEARALFQALKNKKKLPTFTRQFKGKDPSFSKLSISEYEKKYPTWDN